MDEAAAFYRDHVGLGAAVARAEAVKNSLFPGTALAYLTGTDAILQLRRELGSRPGFELGRFHDALLAHGSIPAAACSALPRGEPAKRLAYFITLPAGKPLNYGILSEACGAIAANDGPAEGGQHHREFEEHLK